METPAEQHPEQRRDRHDCHCQSHRMLIVIGSARDRTINATLAWALGLGDVDHKFWFKASSGSSPSMNAPYVPNAAGSNWERFKKPGTNQNGRADDLSATFTDCCFLEEVLVMAHGSTIQIEDRLVNFLPVIFGGRPVRTLTLWLCNSSKDIYPGNLNNRDYYEKLCGLLIPRRCPCMCDLDLCDDRALDPDGNHPAGYRCPDVTDCNKLYAAAWYDHAFNNGQTISIPSKLGIDLAPTNGGQPLTSPDGRMREITVCQDGAGGFVASVQVVAGPSVFDGFSVMSDDGLRKRRPRRRNNINTAWRERDAVPEAPANPVPYDGPMACPGHEGCVR